VKAAADTAHTWMQAKYEAVNPQALKRSVANGAVVRLPAAGDGGEL
jgi:hypothetical protein